MFLHIILISSLSCAQGGLIKPQFNVEDVNSMLEHFNNFKIQHNKEYEAGEEIQRFHNFVENVKKIKELNENNPLTVFGINQFSDWSADEFADYLNFDMSSFDDSACTQMTGDMFPNVTAPSSLDWRRRGAVTPVQNQGTCGSCWAFGATGSVEGANFLKHGALVKLSEQQLVDCDRQSQGCYGGRPDTAFLSIMSNGGQESESDYPYAGQLGNCAFVKSRAQVRVSGCLSCTSISEDQIEQAVASVGPVAIALDATSLQQYSGGILTICSPQDPNHVVLIVGYGEEGGMPYWIIKNSWGSTFGEDGFARIKKGVNCVGIGGAMFYPEIA